MPVSGLDDVAYVTYSHSNHEDVWWMYLNQLRKHSCPLPHYAFLDTSSAMFDSVYVYNDSTPYYKQYLEGLKTVRENYIIYMLEDFILYDDMKPREVEKALNFLKENPGYSYVRLIRSGETADTSLGDGFYEIGLASRRLYSMQASVWRKDDLVKLYETSKVDWIRDEEKHDDAYRAL